MNGNKDQCEPLVSVCIPTYNRAEKLRRSVMALMKGGYTNLEIIISDNASTDETKSVCSELCKFDNRIKYFRHLENQGPTKNFAFARQQATGKYFMWCGDDDYFDSNYISACVDCLESDSCLVMTAGVAAYHNDSGAISHYGREIKLNFDWPLLRMLKYLWLVGDNSIFYGVYNLSSVKKCEIPNMLAGDWGWMASVLLRGKVKVIPAVFVHRDFEMSISSSKASIVTAIGAPKWQSKFPWVAMSVNVTNYLIFKSNEYKGRNPIEKFIAYIVIYGLLVVKGTLENFRLFFSKIPYMRRIYRLYFKK